MQPWESPHQNAAGGTKLQTWRTEEAPLRWGRLDHGAAADPILCSLESGKVTLSPADRLDGQFRPKSELPPDGPSRRRGYDKGAIRVILGVPGRSGFY